MPFFGRISELKRLSETTEKRTSSLIVCLGRRRIGKSRLIQEFGRQFPKYVEIQGLAPRSGQDNSDQLEHFSKELSLQTDMPHVIFNDWTDAFTVLSQQFSRGKCLIFLDEISWMGAHDPDFTGKLKAVWDVRFKKNPNLVLVLCGSVSSWIHKNILQSTDFLGRISLELLVEELPLKDIRNFWLKDEAYLSDLDKVRFLSITGGVPRYLEELNFKASFEQNVQRLCFQKRAMLLEEFHKIFSDIFGRRSETYLQIINSLLDGQRTAAQIAKQIDMEQSGKLSEYLKDLELSGMIRREASWNFSSKQTSLKKHRHRLSDCYLRFYLKFIAPNLNKIQKGLFTETSIEGNARWDAFVGLQFEAIVLNNLETVIKSLGLKMDQVDNAGSFFQSQTARSQGCQIDLLIQTRNTLYVCELKARREVGAAVIHEVQQKVRKLKYPKEFSVKPVLITAGPIHKALLGDDYFSKVISLKELAT